MGFQEATKAFFSNYTNFKDRSSRSEYWWPQLAIIIAAIVIGIIGGILGEAILNILIVVFYLGILIPALAVTVRRLHDHDKSGWWILIAIIPFAGFYLLYLYVTKGTTGSNRFGSDPLGSDSAVFN